MEYEPAQVDTDVLTKKVGLRAVPGIHVVRVSDDRVVVKRGLTEMLVSGTQAAAVVGPLLALLDGSSSADEIISAVPEELSPLCSQLIAALRARRLVRDSDGSGPPVHQGPLARLYDQLGADAASVVPTIAAARIVVVGDTVVSRTVVADLADMGMSNVSARARPALDTGKEAAAPDLVVATSDDGVSGALLRLNREAVVAGRPFLPAWVAGAGGRVGPLVIPGETACLRCAVAGAPDDDGGDVRRGSSLRALVGHVVAAEVVKYVAGAPSSDVVGLSIRIDLANFGGTVRRVLKQPRCPDCSDIARRGTPAVLAGPQIPMRWAGLHA